MRHWVLILSTLIFTSAAWSEDARPVQSLDSIREAANRFLEQEAATMKGEVEVSVGRLDSRLRLARCERPLTTFWPKGGRKMGNITVGVSCEGTVDWSIYVRASVAVFDEIVVAGRPLSRGSKVAPGDVELLRQDLTRLTSGYYSSLEEVVGMELRRPVRTGTVLSRSMLKQPILIRRGEKVSINAVTGSVRVRMEGKALESGARGELIQVENLSSGQKVEAEVIGPGVVRVRM